MFNTSIPSNRVREAREIKAYYKNYYNDDCISLSDEDDDYDDEDYEPDEDYDSDESSESYNKNEYKNHRKIWTKKDDKYLRKLVQLDYDYSDISCCLERTEDAVKARFVKTILCKNYTKKTLNENIHDLCKTFDIKKSDMVRYIGYAIPSFELKETAVKRKIQFM